MEPTDEMRVAAYERVDEAMRKAAHGTYHPHYWARVRKEAVDGILSDLLAIVERDWSAPRACTEDKR